MRCQPVSPTLHDKRLRKIGWDEYSNATFAQDLFFNKAGCDKAQKGEI